MSSESRRNGQRQPVPLWLRVESVLRHKIATGEYRAGDCLQGELTLAAMFNVSRVTVREALRSLAQDGIVQRIQGKGTFVIAGPHTRSEHAVLTSFVGTAYFNEAFPGSGPEPNYRSPRCRHVQIATVEPPVEIREILETPAPDLLRLRRVLVDDGGPYAYVLDYMSHEVGHSLRVEDLSVGWLTQLLNRRLSQRIAEAAQTIETRLADAELAEQLEIPIGAPLLHATRVYRDISGRPIYVAKVWNRADRFRYTATYYFTDVNGRPTGNGTPA
jgi:GntR family transcriptional regulator